MKQNRRNFIKQPSLEGMGFVGVNTIGCAGQPDILEPSPLRHHQSFNMHGFAAPKLDVVRIGIIGLENRGSGTVNRLAGI